MCGLEAWVYMVLYECGCGCECGCSYGCGCGCGCEGGGGMGMGWGGGDDGRLRSGLVFGVAVARVYSGIVSDVERAKA